MTQARLIKRAETTTEVKQLHDKAASTPTRATVRKWMSQYQKTKPHNARANFAALFVEPQIG